MDIISKIQNSVFLTLDETATLKFFFLNSRTPSIFPDLDIKKLAIVGKILRRFDIILHTWLIHLLFH